MVSARLLQNASPHFSWTPESPITANRLERGATRIRTPFLCGELAMPSLSK
jgi:hypothetical protein